jgi:hypothetical protein
MGCSSLDARLVDRRCTLAVVRVTGLKNANTAAGQEGALVEPGGVSARTAQLA